MMTPIEIANAFIHEMNPSHWNGIGEVPSDFDRSELSFQTDKPNVFITLSYSLFFDDYGYDGEWGHSCYLVNGKEDTTIDCVHGYGIDSPQNIADTIEYLLEVNKL